MKAYQKVYQPPYQRARYLKKKNEFIQYLGGECVECGAKEDLQFHHRDPDSKCFAIMERWKLPLAEIRDELDKCDLVCHACHHKHTREQLGWFSYESRSTNADRRRVYYARHREEINKKRRDRRKAQNALQKRLAGSIT